MECVQCALDNGEGVILWLDQLVYSHIQHCLRWHRIRTCSESLSTGTVTYTCNDSMLLRLVHIMTQEVNKIKLVHFSVEVLTLTPDHKMKQAYVILGPHL